MYTWARSLRAIFSSKHEEAFDISGIFRTTECLSGIWYLLINLGTIPSTFVLAFWQKANFKWRLIDREVHSICWIKYKLTSYAHDIDREREFISTVEDNFKQCWYKRRSQLRVSERSQFNSPWGACPVSKWLVCGTEVRCLRFSWDMTLELHRERYSWIMNTPFLPGISPPVWAYERLREINNAYVLKCSRNLSSSYITAFAYSSARWQRVNSRSFLYADFRLELFLKMTILHLISTLRKISYIS